MSNINDNNRFLCQKKIVVEFYNYVNEDTKANIINELKCCNSNDEVCNYISIHKNEIQSPRCDSCQPDKEYTKKAPDKNNLPNSSLKITLSRFDNPDLRVPKPSDSEQLDCDK